MFDPLATLPIMTYKSGASGAGIPRAPDVLRKICFKERDP